MSRTDLKEWLERMEMSPRDIAYETGLSLKTIYRFLEGEDVRLSTVKHFEWFIEKYGSKKPKVTA